MFLARFSGGPFSKRASAASGDNRSQDSTRTQCSSDLPPSPPCHPCCRTPGSREVCLPRLFLARFLVDPFQRGASAASVDNRSLDSTRLALCSVSAGIVTDHEFSHLSVHLLTEGVYEDGARGHLTFRYISGLPRSDFSVWVGPLYQASAGSLAMVTN